MIDHLNLETQTLLLDRNKYMADARKIGEELHSAQLEIERLQEELKRKEETEEKPKRKMPTAEEIVIDLLDRKLTPPQASVALYALQVVQTAQRNAHLIAATRQKEERLRRKSTQQLTAPSPSPKNRAGQSRMTTGAIPRNSSRSRSISQDARRPKSRRAKG